MAEAVPLVLVGVIPYSTIGFKGQRRYWVCALSPPPT